MVKHKPAKLDPNPDRRWRIDNGRPNIEDLRRVLEIVGEALEPRAIVLYGSAVRGEMKAHSDVDLLVVLESQREKEMRWLILEIAAKAGRTVARTHILTTTPTKLEHQRDSVTSAEGAALRHGFVVAEGNRIDPQSERRANELLPEREHDEDTEIERIEMRAREAAEWLTRANRWISEGRQHGNRQEHREQAEAAAETATTMLVAIAAAAGIATEKNTNVEHLLERLKAGGARVPSETAAAARRAARPRMERETPAQVRERWQASNTTARYARRAVARTLDAGRPVLIDKNEASRPPTPTS